MWWEKPHNLDRSVLLSDAISKKIGTLLAFRNELQNKFRWDHARCERKLKSYWRSRVLNASYNILDHEPPIPPACPSIDKALEDSFIGDQLQDSSDLQDFCMRQLAPDAKAALEAIIRESGISVVDLLSRDDWVGIQQSSQNFMLHSVWGSGTSNIGHGPSLEKLLHILFNRFYSVGHMAAWSSHFPSSAERWIWRGSATMLTAAPLWATLWMLWWRAVGSRWKWFWIFRNGDLEIVAGPLFCAIIVGYSFARCYFLVESLASLRLLPEGAYEQVNYTTFLPHVG